MAIRYNFVFFRKLFLIFFVFLMLVTTVLLFSEYVYFKKQSEKLVELQDDYRTYILAVNKILQDYNKIREKLDSLDDKKRGEKKKNESDQVGDDFFYSKIPENLNVFSSDDELIGSGSFLVLNRDLDYLKKKSLQFIRAHSDGKFILERVTFDDWCNYTEYISSKKTEKKKSKKKSKKIKKVKRNKKVSSYGKVDNGKVTKRTKKTDISLSWPIKFDQFWISSLFGPRKKKNGVWGFHYGIDMAALRGTSVRAAYTGIVVEARYTSGYGNTIVIAHSRKYRTRYAHLSKILVRVGKKVRRGSLIGKVGDTGFVRRYPGRDASHLHFELLEFGKKINPVPFIG